MAGRTAGEATALASTDHTPMRGSMATSTGVQAICAMSGTASALMRTAGTIDSRTVRVRTTTGMTNMIAAVDTTESTKPTDVASTGTRASRTQTHAEMTASEEIPPPRRKTTATAIAMAAARIALGSNPTMKR